MRFRGVDSENSEGRLAVANQAAGVDGAKGFLQVDGGGETGDGEAGKMAIEGAAQLLLVTDAGRFFGGGRAAVVLAANFETGGTRLAEPLHE